MAKVKGVGGIFFRATDHRALNEWYKEHLGVPVTKDGCAVFQWRDHHNPMKTHSTVWSAFPRNTDYFGSDAQQYMINYIVESLDEFLAQLKGEGIAVEEEIEESEYGRFGYLTDPEGNRIELWEPPK